MGIGSNIVAKAASHIGEHEVPDGSNSGPEVDKYLAEVGLDPGNEWCAAFACSMVDYTLKEMGFIHYPHPMTGSSGAIIMWGKMYGRAVNPDDVQPGDLGIVIDADTSTGFRHTTVVRDYDGVDTVYTIEGNEGNCVKHGVRNIGDMEYVRPWVVA